MALNLTIKQGSENYTATIVEIKNIFPIEGAPHSLRSPQNAFVNVYT